MSPWQRAVLRVNDVELCTETFGERTAPALLLIAGSGASMDWWEDGLCVRLSESRFVIRYDHRDTGQSASYEPGKPGYTGDDLVDDAIGVLDALELETAHLAWSRERDLPGMEPRLAEWFASAPTPDWSDRAAVVDWGTEYSRAVAGNPETLDEAQARELWGRVFDRTTDIESSMTNHDLLHDQAGRPRGGLDRIAVPTVVIHGTADPMFPLEHGIALADEISGARLVTLEGVGHELPCGAWDEVVAALVDVSASSVP